MNVAKIYFEGNGVKYVPDCVWNVIVKYEDSFSHDLYLDFLTEAL